METDNPFLIKDYATLVEDMLAEAGSGTGGNTALTDTTEGSVVRTLMEVFAREMAVCYQQLDTVYRYAYLDTAEGVALDNVVALLGIHRKKPGHIEGNINLRRQTPAIDDINIRAGTLISGRDIPLFETVERAILPKGSTQVTVDIRSLEPGEEGVTIKSGQLNLMPRPVLGIETVTNESSLSLRSKEETDIELRERARDALHHASRGTKSAIEVTIRSLGIDQVKIYDQIADRPGEVDVVLGDTDIDAALLEKARIEIDKVRPAGITVYVKTAERIWLNISATLELDKSYEDHILDKVESEINANITSYINSIGNGERVRWSKITNILSTHDAVRSINSTAGMPYIKAYQRNNDIETDVSSNFVMTNNDVQVGPNDRVGLEPNTPAVHISLEPPYLDVWLDVTLTDELSDAELNTKILSPLKNLIEKINSTLNTEDIPNLDCDFNDIFYTPKNKVKGLVSIITLRHTGLEGKVVELNKDFLSDTLYKRERITMRKVFIEGKPVG